MLIAFTESPQKALYVFVLYIGIQFIESYFFDPGDPAAGDIIAAGFTDWSQVLLGLFAGLWGVMLAAPLAVTGMVMVKMMYVEDVLHDYSVEYLEESRSQQNVATS